jgi:hypothetical protein
MKNSAGENPSLTPIFCRGENSYFGFFQGMDSVV